MLKPSDNEMLTRVGPNTLGGEWLRRYWHPIAISDRWTGIKTLWQCDEQFQFKGRFGTVAQFGERLGTFKGNPTAIRILGEDLVLFRDGGGRLGLLGLHCPHRGATLDLGRVRQDGIECCYHGWKFDVDGNCLEQPAEPAASTLKNKVHHTAYRVKELGGLIWAYLGPVKRRFFPRSTWLREKTAFAQSRTTAFGRQIFSKPSKTLRTLPTREYCTRALAASAATSGGTRFLKQLGKKTSSD